MCTLNDSIWCIHTIMYIPDSVIQFDAKSYIIQTEGCTSKWNVYVLPSNLKIELFGRGLRNPIMTVSSWIELWHLERFFLLCFQHSTVEYKLKMTSFGLFALLLDGKIGVYAKRKSIYCPNRLLLYRIASWLLAISDGNLLCCSD